MQESARGRYLQAMGIDRYLLRVRGSGDVAAAPEHAGQPAVPPEALAERPVAVVRQLLDVDEAERRDEVPAAAAQTDTGKQLAGEADRVPRFSLCVLDLQGSILLLDDALLSQGELRLEQLQLLGDLLRTARMLHHGDGTGDVQIQSFYWPQVEDPSLDQSVPRAREALAHYLRKRTVGSGPLLWFDAVHATAASASVLDAKTVAGLGGPAISLQPELLDLTAPGTVRAAAWQALQALGTTA